MVAKSGSPGKSGTNQANMFCLKNIRGKTRNSTNSRDNYGNVREIACLRFSVDRFSSMLEEKENCWVLFV